MTQACRQWAVITGCSSGIGKALAVRLSTLNYNVLAIGRRKERLVQTKHAGKSENIHPLQCDIGIPSHWEKIINFIPLQDRIKILIHNAAIGDPSHLGSIDYDHWNYAVTVNVTAPLFLTQKFLKRLDENNGRILHLGTGVAFNPQLGTATYGVTKCAFHRLYQQIKVDLEQGSRYKNVRIASLSPGVVRTEGVYDHYDKAKALKLPHTEYFDSVFASNADIPMDRCIDFIVKLLHSSDDIFSKQEWSTSSKL